MHAESAPDQLAERGDQSASVGDMTRAEQYYVAALRANGEALFDAGAHAEFHRGFVQVVWLVEEEVEVATADEQTDECRGGERNDDRAGHRSTQWSSARVARSMSDWMTRPR